MNTLQKLYILDHSFFEPQIPITLAFLSVLQLTSWLFHGKQKFKVIEARYPIFKVFFAEYKACSKNMEIFQIQKWITILMESPWHLHYSSYLFCTLAGWIQSLNHAIFISISMPLFPQLSSNPNLHIPLCPPHFNPVLKAQPQKYSFSF